MKAADREALSYAQMMLTCDADAMFGDSTKGDERRLRRAIAYIGQLLREPGKKVVKAPAYKVAAHTVVWDLAACPASGAAQRNPPETAPEGAE